MDLKMNAQQARWLWNEMIWSDGFDHRTPMGMVALSHGIGGITDPKDYQKAADFLESFAKLLRGEGEDAIR